MVAVVLSIQLGAVNSAWAIDVVDCFGGPPAPITMITTDGAICFGGSPGADGVGEFVEDFSSGGYYCRVFFVPEGSDSSRAVSFEPGEFSTLNAMVVGIEIIPPP